MSIHEPADPIAPIADTSTFRIQLRSGIWNVRLDGAFRGDYRGLQIAKESIEKNVQALRLAGRSVHILTLSAGGAILNSQVMAAI